MPVHSAGSPGPFVIIMPSGFAAITSAASKLHGYTVTLHPLFKRQRIIFFLVPTSITAIFLSASVLTEPMSPGTYSCLLSHETFSTTPVTLYSLSFGIISSIL